VAEPVVCDLSLTEDHHRLAAQASELFGPVDVLLDDAAVTFLLPSTALGLRWPPSCTTTMASR
jgi:NAD(P)-dependent dehydrogenase (short-subunit alcohol dehydrogenase family)